MNKDYAMRKTTMIVLSGILLASGIAMMEIGERTLTAGVFAILLLVVVVLYRRFRQSAGGVPWVFQAAAAVAVTLGILTLISGVAHSTAVAALALREHEWSPLTILRFTTGAMLMYAGAMSAAVFHAIRAGRDSLSCFYYRDWLRMKDMRLLARRHQFTRVIVLTAALLVVQSTAGVGQTPSGQTTSGQPAAIALDQLIPAIDAHFKRFQQNAHVPGLVYGIVRSGTLQHVGVMGLQDMDARRPVTADTLFRIASMSKAFTALAILKLRDEGKLTLDALAETYVPELKAWRYPTTDSPRIRVRDLLSHASGFVTDDPWGDRQQVLPEAEFTRMLRDGVPFTRAPAIAYEYSNFGYALLGRIITNVSGQPFKDYIEQTIMRPLGMTATGYDIHASPLDRRAIGYRWENEKFVREPDMAHGAFGSMGGVQTSATEYAKWVAFLLSAWPPRDGAEAGPARRATVRELSQGLNFPQRGPRPGSNDARCVQAMTYGMGLRVAQDCDAGLTLAHGGGYPGYGSYVLLLPEHDTGIFAFTNRTYSGPTGAVWDAAMELHKAGWFRPRALPVSTALAQAYDSVKAMAKAHGIGPGRSLLAQNFLMDRSEENWAAEFARLDREAGACRTDAPITATGALAGRFTWTCERGAISGSVLLAPTNPPTIQSLGLTVARPR
jgi:CubicO group peptidase (beta-lactamase class C family)